MRILGAHPAGSRGYSRSLGRKARPIAAEARAVVSAPLAVAGVEKGEDLPRLLRRPRPVAGFIAQLIATHQQVEQTREKRRCAPHIAVKAYHQASKLA